MGEPIGHTRRESLAALSEGQREALAAHLRERLRSGRSPRLVAFVALEADVSVEALRSHLGARLPEHMIPAEFVVLPELPKTPHGKADRRRLALLGPTRGSSEDRSQRGETPRSELETKLCTIWSEVLAVPRVGIHDDFFQLGGDSILGIQMVSRAVQAGIALTMRLFVRNRTIAALAAAVESAESPSASRADQGQGRGSGPVPLTPIQHWFFQRELPAPAWWNQEVLLELPENVGLEDLRRAFRDLAVRHEALRARYLRSGSEWGCENAPAPPDSSVEEFETLEEASILHEQLDLASGSLVRAGLIGPSRRLLIVAHHLAVDVVTWRLLIDDLAAFLRGDRQPPAGRTVREWAEALVESADSGRWDEQLPFWREMASEGRADPPIDFEPERPPEERDCPVFTQTFDPAATERLLERGSGDRGGGVADCLLTALVRALGDRTGHRGKWRIGLESHGRHEWHEGLDASRTAGWFSAYFPVVFSLPEDRSGGAERGLQAVSDRLRSIPDGGIGFGVLRYLKADPDLAAAPEPAILFNYLGRTGGERSSSELKPIAVDTGRCRDPAGASSHRLEVNALIESGSLKVRWRYSRRHNKEETIGGLADRFRERLEELLAGGARESGNDDSDECAPAGEAGGCSESEASFPLTPNQEALLWHHLQHPQEDAGRLELKFRLEGVFDREAFERAWRKVIGRHDALRASAHWDDPGGPFQTVHGAVPFALDDETAIPAPLDLRRAPVMRVAVRPLEAGDHEVIWLCHHLFLDGWSATLVLREVVASYAALRKGPVPEGGPAPPSFGSYARWIAEMDWEEAAIYWRQALDHARPVDVPGVFTGLKGGPSEDLPAGLAERLVRQVAAEGVTAATFFQVAWALLLGKLRGERDIVFGNTVSGRSVPVPGVESLVGLCAGVCPVRVRWSPDEAVSDLIRRTHNQRLEALAFEHAPLGRIQSWAGLPPGKALFDTLLTVGNYPRAAFEADDVRLTGTEGAITSTLPLTLAIEPVDRFRLSWIASPAWEVLLPWMRGCMLELLEGMSSDPAMPIARLLSGLSEGPDDPAGKEGERAAGETAGPQPAADRVEDRILKIWQEVFGNAVRSVEHSFSELGGTSLQAAQLTTRLAETFGGQVPLDLVFKTPTVRRMAAVVREGTGSMTWPILVPIRATGSRPPLFLVHGLGGGIFNYYSWADELPEDQPVFVLQAPVEPLSDLRAIAAAYLEEVRTRQPEGPYRLGGFCFGAAVAFEMTCQLEAAGEEVDYLLVIDSVLPSLRPGSAAMTLAALRRGDAGQLMVRALSRAKRIGRRFRRALAAPDRKGMEERMEDVIDVSAYPGPYRDTAEVHFRALQAYLPESRCRVEIHLIRSDSDMGAADHCLGWDRVSSGVAVDVIPCRHDEIIYSGRVKEVTAALRRGLGAR